ncbi:MAG: tRNA (adenine-N1)-methyltransferase [Candidatus Aenigmatarchaeota archaeon]
MKVKKGQLVFLVSRTKRYLVPAEGKFSCKYGAIEMKKLVGKRFGTKVKIGKEGFVVIEPSFLDMLFKKAVRGPQVILPKDAAVIAAETGCGKGWKVVDAGSGSGFLVLMLGNVGCDVVSYEKNKDFLKVAKKNVKIMGVKNVKIKERDVTKGIPDRNVSLVTLDLEKPEKVIKHAFRALKPGGWLAIFSLHTEQVTAVRKELKKYEMTSVKTVESLHREWQFQAGKRTWTRPKTHMLGHTGFLTFARKL